MSDLRYAIRTLAKNPGFTAVAILTIALGVAANTAIFAVVNTVLLRDLPYREPDRLVVLFEKRPREDRLKGPVAPADFFDWRRDARSFSAMAAQFPGPVNLTGVGEPIHAGRDVVSPAYFDVLGIRPFLGRTFMAEEEQIGRSKVAVVSHGLWQRQFGGDRSIVGRRILLNGEPHEIVGVLPADARFPDRATELWTPMALPDRERADRGLHFLTVIARLAPGVTLAAAQAEMDTISARLQQAFPDFNRGHAANAVSLRDQLVGDVRPALLVLLGAGGFVLLIGCANVANLLLSRAATRQQELAVRSALGAGRGRLVRQLIVESVVLSFTAGAGGLLLATWGIDVLRGLMPAGIVWLDEFRIDGVALAFTLLLSLAAGLLFGTAPAFQASRLDLIDALKVSGTTTTRAGARRLGGALVAAEIALAVMLLSGAGLLVRSFMRLQNVAPGFDPRGVVVTRVVLPETTYADLPQVGDFFRRLVDGAASLPGVEHAGTISHLPLSGLDARLGIAIEGRAPNPQEPTRAHLRAVAGGYLQTMRIPLKAGRYVEARDRRDAPPVVVINETMARRYWPNVDPVGRRIRFGQLPMFAGKGSGVWREVVGVIGDVRHWGLDAAVNPEVHVPVEQFPMPPRVGHLVVRARDNPLDLAGAIRARIAAIDKNLPASDIRTLEQVLAGSISSRRFYMLLLGIFAALGLALAAVGTYGVVSYLVTQRTREIGIRLALGADVADVLRLVVGHGLLLTAIGVALGLAGAAATTRLLSTLLFGVTPTDPATLAVIVGILVLAALVASYVPARRAARIDPTKALRAE